MKNQQIKKIIYTAALIGTGILLAVSVIYFLSVIVHFRSDLQTTTESVAEQMATEAAGDINNVLAAELSRVEVVAENIIYAGSDRAEINRILTAYVENVEHKSYIGNLRYYTDNKTVEHREDGTTLEAGTRKSPDIKRVLDRTEPSFTGIFEGNYDENIRYIALWYPFKPEDHADIDGFVIYYRPDVLFAATAVFKEQEQAESGQTSSGMSSEFSGICSRDESDETSWAIDVIGSNNFSLYVHERIFTQLASMTHGHSGIKALQSAVDQRLTRVETVTISSEKYSICVTPVPLTNGELIAVEIYDPQVIYRTSYNFMSQMEGALIFLGILFIAALLYLNYERTHLRDKKEQEEQIDSVSGCLTYRYFLSHSEELVDKNPAQRYAFLMIRINYLQYLGQLYGDEIFLKVIRFVGEVFEKVLDHTETYGYISDNNFSALLHYKEEAELMNRLRMIHAIIYNFPDLKSKNNHVKVTFGIYLVRPGEKNSTLQCLDKAGMALRSSSFAVDSVFRFYNDELGEGQNRQAEIELKMETSLANHDFKVFYQPKFNLNKETIDSAEALVRWYDPDKHRYYPPADFVQLFEENGFIVKLDHYVCETVCQFAAERIKAGKKLAPISVNASRVTATEPDFVRFYLSLKRKYDLPANLLTIEFTESMAMENYEVLRKIVGDLKEGGIGSSVDDFGSGFSSYGILKELRMDELKLDRFFITPGIDPMRDDALLNSVIKLGQKLGMKVTQEGVESAEMMDKLKKAGCNTIQGYYYSRPIPEADFAAFLDREAGAKEVAQQ